MPALQQHQMTNFTKEPSIKLIPSDPMTNTILIIYCVSSTGASVAYKSTWRRVHLKKNKVEDIKHHNGSSYRCSPLDIDYIIEATVHFQHQNAQLSRIVQSNVVKVSRQLKQKKMLLKQPILGRTNIHQIPLQMKLLVQENTLTITPAPQQFSHLSIVLPISDLQAETEGNQLAFKMTFKQKIQQFSNIAAQMIGWKPHIKNSEVVWEFPSDLNRDMVLLGITEAGHRPFKFQHGLHFPITARNLDKTGKITGRDKEGIADKSANKSQKSISPSAAFNQKFRMTNKEPLMKRSFTGALNNDKKKETPIAPTTPNVNLDRNNNKQRQFLNVFDDDDLEFLNSPIPQSTPANNALKPKPQKPIQKVSGHDDGPSINLRGSFEQLQKSFNSNINQQTLDRVFGYDNIDSSKKIQGELDRLKIENETLKKQVEVISHLTKENNSIKRKYLEMKEQVNRLEMERKVILTDKLRCEVNWHKEIQEKEALKKELEHMKETVRNNSAINMERSLRTASFHEPSGIDKSVEYRQTGKELNHPPIKNYYH